MDRELTRLEKGIIVKIDEENFIKLEELTGFLSRAAYPDFYETIALENELGRFLLFRFIKGHG